MEDGNEERLIIALEPEAASIWCKKLPSDGFITEKHNCTPLDECLGTRYIVIDCGGTLHNSNIYNMLHKNSIN